MRGFWLLTDGVVEGRNFGEAWGVRAGRPGSSPEPPEGARVVLKEPGLPIIRKDRDEVTSKVVRRPRKGYSRGSCGLQHPVEARKGHLGGSRVAGRGH